MRPTNEPARRSASTAPAVSRRILREYRGWAVSWRILRYYRGEGGFADNPAGAPGGVRCHVFNTGRGA